MDAEARRRAEKVCESYVKLTGQPIAYGLLSLIETALIKYVAEAMNAVEERVAPEQRAMAEEIARLRACIEGTCVGHTQGCAAALRAVPEGEGK